MPETTSSAFLFGKGVFSTIAIINGAPFLWQKHWRRLRVNAAKLEIDIAEYEEAEIFEALTLEIERQKLKNGRARVTFLDESEIEVWSSCNVKKTSLSIITAERRPVPPEFSLTFSPFHINTASPLVGMKSCNYMEHLLAYNEAKNRGFDEAIRLNGSSEVASACMANIFWLSNGKLCTPSLKTGCLAGTTREFILENLSCDEVEAGMDEINNAEAIFLTSAGIGIVSVRDFDGKPLGVGEHEIQKLSPFSD
jgi:branched-chain amino acid aminotransferase